VGTVRKVLGALLRVRGAAALLSVTAALPLVMGQCAPPGADPAVPRAPRYGDGTHVVNRGFVPGLYFATGGNCSWERLSGLRGSWAETIQRGGITPGQNVVYVPSTDVAFRSRGCGTWTWFDPPVFARVIGDGDWDVRTQMGANLWVAQNPTVGCWWERASGYTHVDEVIARDNTYQGESEPRTVPSQFIVQVLSTDVRFSTQWCGTWVPFDPPVQAVAISDGDWDVARQMGPGRWRAVAEGGCDWQRASGYTHHPSEVIARGFAENDEVVVDVAPTDVRFSSSGCGTWTRIGSL
jgi:hypothetical protein